MASSNHIIAELPSSNLASPHELAPSTVEPSHIYAGHSSTEEKAQDFECRLRALEKAFQEHQEVCSSRRSKSALMRALAKLLIPGSSGSSQKTQTYSQISLGTQSESDRGQYIKRWAISQVSLGQYESLKSQSQHHPSSSDRSLVKALPDGTLPSSSLTELMNTEKILPVEMMDTSPVDINSPVEIMSTERKRMSELRFTAATAVESKMNSPNRAMHSIPAFPTTPVVARTANSNIINSTPMVSPTGISIMVDSLVAGSSNISPASTFTPLSSLSTGSPLDAGLRHVTSRTRRRSTKDSLGPTNLSPTQSPITFTGDLALGATQPFEFIMASPDITTPQFAPYFPGQMTQSHMSTVPESPMGVHPHFTYTNNSGWQGEESPIVPNAAYFDNGEHHWNSASAGDNLYVSAPNHIQGEPMHTFPSTMSDVPGEAPTHTSFDTDGSAVGQLAGEPSLFGCQPCKFYPDPGPDQRKKLAKHKRTDKHREITGEGDVETFQCRHCEATYNRRDNLVQHEKSHEFAPLPNDRPAKRRRQSSIAIHSGRK